MGIRYPMKFGSHLPVLMKLISITDSHVLELGSGMYSTPYLHWACVPQGRTLFTYDNNPRYFEEVKQFEDKYFHHVELVTDWDKIEIEHSWSFALIDHAPSERRIVEIERLAQHALYVVIHDTDPRQEHHYHYNSIWDLFKYRWEYKPMTTWTTVVSNYDSDLRHFSI